MDMCVRTGGRLSAGSAAAIQKNWQAAIAQLRVDLLLPQCRDKAKKRHAESVCQRGKDSCGTIMEHFESQLLH